MKKIIFTEEFCQPENLFPFSLTRRVCDIRIGILTIREKWEKALGVSSVNKKEDDYKDDENAFLISKNEIDGDCLMIHGNVLPDTKLISIIKKLKNGEFISYKEKESVIFKFGKEDIKGNNNIKIKKAIPVKEEIPAIHYPWDIVKLNANAIINDFKLLTNKRKTAAISKTNKLTAGKNIFLEKGVRMEHCIINAGEGPVYIGKNVLVMEGVTIRGPVSIGEGAVIKMGAKIYGGTTIGNYCVAGGEIKNSVMMDYSNKAHDGYLGDSVIGEWCNIGAGSSNSNLKNNAGIVKVWTQNGEIEAGQKCGMFLGDHTKLAINTAVNTGTITGICCNVFGTGLTPKYIPGFSWGSEGVKRFELAKAIEGIEAWKKLKQKTVSEREKTILTHIFENY